MKVLLRGVHLPLTDGLRAYVKKHLLDPLAHFYRHEAAEIDIQLKDRTGPHRGDGMECSVTIHMPWHATLHIRESGEDMYRCISFVRDRLERVAKRELERGLGEKRRDTVRVRPATSR
jgi:ribosomal subunit interface protein